MLTVEPNLLAAVVGAAVSGVVILLLLTRAHVRKLNAENGRLAGDLATLRKSAARIELFNTQLADKVVSTDSILQFVVDGTHDAVFVKDKSGRYVLVNTAVCKILGRDRGQILGRTDREILPAALADKLMEADRLVLEKNESVTIEETVDLGARPRTFLSSKDPLRDQHGNLIGVVGVARDITELKRVDTERELMLDQEREARSSAERANKMKDEFIAVLSHELRTPLNAILGWAQLLRHKAPDPAKLAQGIETIERNARIQVQMVNDLLDINRIMHGKLELSKEPVDLGRVIESALDSVAPAARLKPVEIVKDIQGSVIVQADATRLQQVILNLVGNAIKFTPAGGIIRVRSRVLDGHVSLTVEDNGVGIAPDVLPHLFDRFKQADSSITRKYGGLGLGLALVRSLTELHGGTVTVRSEGQGKGAIFELCLPSDIHISEASVVEEVAPMNEEEQPTLSGLKVLAVDDEPDSRELVRRILEERDVDVKVAGSADEALKLLKTFRPDVIVSDIGMPEEDGYTLIKRIRQLPGEQGGNVPALALTAYAREQDRTYVLQQGFQSHMPKPFRPADLVNEILNLTH